MNEVLIGNALNVLKTLPKESIHCAVTSPPYWGLRNYEIPDSIWPGIAGWGGRIGIQDPACQHEWGEEIPRTHEGGGNEGVPEEWQRPSRAAHTGGTSGQFCVKCGVWKGQLGLEPTPELYIFHLFEIFKELKRVLRNDGTFWLNISDSYMGSNQGSGQHGPITTGIQDVKKGYFAAGEHRRTPLSYKHPTLKPKDLVGIPWRLAFSLQEDGWWLRSDNIWSKPNCMPESCTDRPTRNHEYVFLFTKSKNYFYDSEAVKEDSVDPESYTGMKPRNPTQMMNFDSEHCKIAGSVKSGQRQKGGKKYPKKNMRTVWTITTHSYREAHFATFPEALAERCIKAGCPEFVCKKCGKGREKIYENISGFDEDGNCLACGESKSKHHQSPKSGIGINAPIFEDVYIPCGLKKEIGITDCGCGAGFEPGVVIDPFIGSGTVAKVAKREKRNWLGIDLGYSELVDKRVAEIMEGLFFNQ